MDTFKLTISEDSRIPYKGQARYCRIATPEGVIGFEPGHEGFVGILAAGSELSYTDGNGTEHVLHVAWGTFLFEDNVCTVAMASAGGK